MKKLCILFYCLMALPLTAFEKEPSLPVTPFALFTIPKSGSHLLIKALYFMTGFSPFWHNDKPPSLQKLYARYNFPYTHCCLSPKLLKYYSSAPAKQILGIRDLRDVCVSIVFQIRKGTWPEFTNFPEKTIQFNKMDFDQQLLYVINQEYKLDPPNIALQLGIRNVAQQASALARDPNILICRYEDLVGEQGGGTLEAQEAILKKIATHIGLSLSAGDLEHLTANLYGNQDNPFGTIDFKEYQSTFREGKIGGWKEHFNPIHKKTFKERLGQALIDLGYEENNDW